MYAELFQPKGRQQLTKKQLPTQNQNRCGCQARGGCGHTQTYSRTRFGRSLFARTCVDVEHYQEWKAGLQSIDSKNGCGCKAGAWKIPLSVAWQGGEWNALLNFPKGKCKPIHDRVRNKLGEGFALSGIKTWLLTWALKFPIFQRF